MPRAACLSVGSRSGPEGRGRREHDQQPRLHLGPVLVFASVMGLATVCAGQPAVDRGATEAAALERIQAEIGTPTCSAAADCRTLAVGVKSCGGPERWLAWSTRVSRPDHLQKWADQLKLQQRKRLTVEGVVSTCSVVLDPGATCEAGLCKLTSKNAAD